jgi:DnaJ homolog subfamily B member 4
VFVIAEQPHPRFTRRGNDLHTRVQLPLVTALTGSSESGATGAGVVAVRHLDGRNLPLPLGNSPITPGTTLKLVGEGMPISRSSPGQRGDMYVTVDVVFPKSLTAEQKAALRRALPAS